MDHKKANKKRQSAFSGHKPKHRQSLSLRAPLLMHKSVSQTPILKRGATCNPALKNKLDQMALPLMPLVQITTGRIHPAFPITILNYWLLTDDQLESMAHFYHQGTSSYWSSQYPHPVQWESQLPIKEKRRLFGEFIGLHGCKTPTKLKIAQELLDKAMREAAIASHTAKMSSPHFKN